MAAASSMHAFLGSPVAGFSNRTSLTQHLAPGNVAAVKRDAKFQVRSMSEDGGKAPKQKVSTKFSDILAFSGPGPERINGRLAMIGFVTAIGVELAGGQDVFDQLQNGGIAWFWGSTVLLSLASLIPLSKGVTAESESEGVMTSDAELWNGRFAMLGLVALALTEYVKGGALV